MVVMLGGRMLVVQGKLSGSSSLAVVIVIKLRGSNSSHNK